MQALRQGGEPGLLPLIDVEELPVAPGHHGGTGHVQEEPPGGDGLLVPDPLLEGLVREVEGGDVPEVLLLDIGAAPQFPDEIRDPGGHNLVIDRILVFPGLNAPGGDLGCAQALAVLDAALQADHIPVEPGRGHAVTAVAVDLDEVRTFMGCPGGGGGSAVLVAA